MENIIHEAIRASQKKDESFQVQDLGPSCDLPVFISMVSFGKGPCILNHALSLCEVKLVPECITTGT